MIKYVRKTLIYLVLAAFALWVLVPFYIIVVTSFKTNRESLSVPFSWFPRDGFHIDGYVKVLTADASGGGGLSTIIRGFINTIWIVTPPTLVGLMMSSVSAFSFAKLNFRGKGFLFGFLLATMMLPNVIMLTPSYMIYDLIGWVDTPFPLMIPGMFGAAACVFFMRQFYMGIPTDLVEAAKLDGMSYLGIFFKIMVPLSVPALLSQGILGFIAGYNDYFGPLLYLHSPSMYTLQIALNFFLGTYSFDWQTVMAGAVTALIPTLIIYALAQRYFIQGIATAGLKV